MEKHMNQRTDQRVRRPVNEEPSPTCIERDLDGSGDSEQKSPHEVNDNAWAQETADKPEANQSSRA
jgi:hypothetical protein